MDAVVLLGLNVRKYRKLRGMSQEQLGLDTEIKRSYISDLERGTRNPSIKAVERLAKALNVELHQLLLPFED